MIEIRHTDPNTAALRVAYDALYRRTTTEHARSYYTWILDQLSPRPGARLIDLCCGTGLLAHEAQQRGLDAIGVDFAIEALRATPNPVAVGDAELLPFADMSFEYVVNLGSLEHLANMEVGVREMARILKPGGTCCVLVPNTFGLLWTIRRAKQIGDIDDDGQPLQRYGTRVQWQRVLEQGGLHVERVVGYELPPPNTLAMWVEYLRNPWYRLFPLMLWRFVPVNLASMLVYFCRRAPARSEER